MQKIIIVKRIDEKYLYDTHSLLLKLIKNRKILSFFFDERQTIKKRSGWYLADEFVTKIQVSVDWRSR